MIDLRAGDDDGEGCAISLDDPAAVKLMIDFLYQDDYVLQESTPASILGGQDEVDNIQTNDAMAAAEVPESHQLSDVIALGGSTDNISANLSSATNNFPSSVAGTKNERRNRRQISASRAGSEATGTPPSTRYAHFGILAMHAKMYALGSKYHIAELQHAALEKFEAAIDVNLDPYDCAEAITFVYDRTPNSDTRLKDILDQAIVDNAPHLIHNSTFEVAVDSVDGLPYRLFKLRVSQSYVEHVACANCGRKVKCGNRAGTQYTRAGWSASVPDGRCDTCERQSVW